MTKHRKCLFLSCYFPPPFVGGSLIYYYYLLSKCTDDDVVVATRPATGSAEFDSGMPYTIVRNGGIVASETCRLRRMLWPLLLFPLLTMWILRYRVSIVHSGSFKYDMIGAWLAARLTRRKLMVTIHGEELATCSAEGVGYRAARARRWVSWLRNAHDNISLRLLRRCDRVLTCSYFTKRLIMDQGVPEDRIIVVTPGVDAGKVACEPRISPELASRLAGKRLVVTIGRFTPRKGQDMVLRSLPQLVERFPDLTYVMAGAGEFDAEYRDRCDAIVREHGLQNHAMMLSNLDSEAVAWLYHACEVFIMANRTMPDGDTEGYGIVFLEAGAWGKPVIGGRAGGVVDAVDEGMTGLLVDGTSVDDIANAIRRLLSDAALARRLGDGGREKVRRSTWDAKADQYRELLDQLAEVSKG